MLVSTETDNKVITPIIILIFDYLFSLLGY